MRLIIGKYLLGVSLLMLSAGLIVAYSNPLLELWRSARHARRVLFVLAAGLLCAYAGTKQNPPLTGLASINLHDDTVDAEEIARGYRVVSVLTNASVDFSCPEGAVINERWYAHGAYQAWSHLDLAPFSFPLGTNDISVFAVFTDGKIRPTPRDEEHTLGLGMSPMLAKEGRSKFWLDRTSAGGRRLTWQNFHPEGDPEKLASLQIELSPTGDFIARSNELEVVFQRVDPNDFDGDGIPNSIDDRQFHYDGSFFGLSSVLSENAESNAYYQVKIVAPAVNAEVLFVGDGQSDLPDPHFIAKAGETNCVSLLIGKRYDVVASRPVECFCDGSEQGFGAVEINSPDRRHFNVVYPVTIMSTNTGHQIAMSVLPLGLNGIFVWTNSCCGIVECATGYEVQCDGCNCHGCSIVGYYEYEGYRLPAWGGVCGCEYDPERDVGFSLGLSVPRCIFVNNDNAFETQEDDLRPITVSFSPGESELEDAVLSLSCTTGNDHVRFWADASRLVPVALPVSIGASTAHGLTIYVEGVETSDEMEDVTIRLEYKYRQNSPLVRSARLTVAKVAKVTLSSPVVAESVEFEGQQPCPFNVEHSPNPDRHLMIPFQPVADQETLAVTNFYVDAELSILPTGFVIPNIDAVWTRLPGTPDSGSFTEVCGPSARFANPKTGGVYRFAVTYGGSPITECNLVLPLAGAVCDAQMLADLSRCEVAVSNILEFAQRHRLSATSFRLGANLFWYNGHGDYLGRPDNRETPTVWYHNQVNDRTGMGASMTWFGHPTPIAKASNFVVGYAMRKIGASDLMMMCAQGFGTFRGVREEMFDAAMSIVDSNTTYGQAVSNAVHGIWMKREKSLVIRQWPMENSVDNHVDNQLFHDVNRQFRSAEFLEFSSSEDFAQKLEEVF